MECGSLRPAHYIEGSSVTYMCDDGFSPSLAMDAECQPDGNWQPDPAGVVCTAAITSNGTLNDAIIICKINLRKCH